MVYIKIASDFSEKAATHSAAGLWLAGTHSALGLFIFFSCKGMPRGLPHHLSTKKHMNKAPSTETFLVPKMDKKMGDNFDFHFVVIKNQKPRQ